ncbi:helix-turn-helix domain-containing protein [uncultured Pseudoteredinibacter sp.]|uniref:hybrid sensor histidine kinase/response regulator transcription factor n=1 Tax=uncultured Pseudoteredinibacter sp. TaxID=1641701 RepID=UPI00260F0E32|nr:helix-turn-helix domain-containing protein [uncultured Pseudoteredinibacter sp.]
MKDISGTEHAHISCRNSRGKIAYVRDILGEDKLPELFADILSPDTLISDQYSYMGKALDVEYFLDVNNWYSNEINLKFFANLSAMGVDAYHTGRYTISHAKETFNTAILAYMRLLSPKGIIQKANQVNGIYNRTKTVVANHISDDSAKLTLRYHPGCEHNEQVTRQNIGVYSAILAHSGFQVVDYGTQEFESPDPRTEVWFKWEKESRWKRLWWLVGKVCTRPFAHYMQSSDVIKSYHGDLAKSFEQEIIEKEKQRQLSEDYYQQLLEEQAQREAKLNLLVEQKTNELQNLLQEKQRLFENISHELKTPLSLVLGPLELLSRENLNEQQTQLLAQAQSNSERLQALVEQVLNLAEIKLVKAQEVVIDLPQQVNTIAAGFTALLDQKQIQYKVHNKIQGRAKIRLFDQALETMFGNLLSNAIKYSAPEKTISVFLEEYDDCYSIKVEDENTVISPDLESKLFERFTRGESQEEGHGLGLAIVKECCDEIGAKISLQTSERGNCFTLELPLIEAKLDNTIKEDKPKLTSSASSSTVGSTEKAQLLLVEDNTELADFIMQALGKEFSIKHCLDGKAALELLNNDDDGNIELIVSDVMMPNIDGLELCQTLKNDLRFAHIPLILLSAKSDNQSRRLGIQAQADDYIGKPFSVELLLQKLRNWKNTHRAAQERFKAFLLPSSLKNKESRTEHEFLQRFRQTLSELYTDNEVRSPQLAKQMGVSERQLSRRLQSLAGAGPAELLRNYRLEIARQLLKAGASTKTACFECGFNSMSHFSQLFKSHFGIPPSKVEREQDSEKLTEAETC